MRKEGAFFVKEGKKFHYIHRWRKRAEIKDKWKWKHDPK